MGALLVRMKATPPKSAAGAPLDWSCFEKGLFGICRQLQSAGTPRVPVYQGIFHTSADLSLLSPRSPTRSILLTARDASKELMLSSAACLSCFLVGRCHSAFSNGVQGLAGTASIT